MHAYAPVILTRMCNTRHRPAWQQHTRAGSSSRAVCRIPKLLSRLPGDVHLAEQLVHLVLQHPLVVQELLHQRHVKLGQLPACTSSKHCRGEGCAAAAGGGGGGGGGAYLTA